MMQRAATTALPVASNVLAQQQRGMATLKAIQIRLKSVKNIQKITQSMKMVSAAKYTRAERELKQARPLEASKQFYEKAEIAVVPEESKKLYVAITSDRGKLNYFNLERDLIVRFKVCAALFIPVLLVPFEESSKLTPASKFSASETSRVLCCRDFMARTSSWLPMR